MARQWVWFFPIISAIILLFQKTNLQKSVKTNCTLSADLLPSRCAGYSQSTSIPSNLYFFKYSAALDAILFRLLEDAAIDENVFEPSLQPPMLNKSFTFEFFFLRAATCLITSKRRN